MTTRTLHRTGLYPAVQAPAMPSTRGRLFARMPLVVAAVTGLVFWLVTAMGILHAAA